MKLFQKENKKKISQQHNCKMEKQIKMVKSGPQFNSGIVNIP